MATELRLIGEQFDLGGEWLDAAPAGAGHIHETVVARVRSGSGERRFVLQRLNTRVFPDIEALVSNCRRITDHVRERLDRRGERELDRRCLRMVSTLAGGAVYWDAEGEPWRAFAFIEGTRTFQTAERSDIAFEAARAFGEFQSLLADLPGPPLAETIPHFHDPPRRMAALERSAASDPCARASGVSAELDAARAAFASVQAGLAAAEALPRRHVHNDCKLNNVLFDESGRSALCVIDLDTAMPGDVSFDFGEIVRSATCPAPEDEPDLDRIHVQRDRYEAVVRGFLRGVAGQLAPAELDALPLAGPVLALENAIRFLADHLDGDVYFRALREGHNLDRARAQLRLFEKLMDASGEAAQLVAEATRAATPSRD